MVQLWKPLGKKGFLLCAGHLQNCTNSYLPHIEFYAVCGHGESVNICDCAVVGQEYNVFVCGKKCQAEKKPCFDKDALASIKGHDL